MSDLPKEQQTAFQRWELASFGDDANQSINASSKHEQADNKELVEAIREQARLEGYAAGLAEGRTAGFEEGRTQGAQQAAQLQKIAQSFQHELQHANELVSQEILDLALDVAKAILKSSLTIRPELVLPVVSEAIRYLPLVEQPAILFLHPEDASVIRQYLDDELDKAGWRLSEDPQVKRGGCRVETASNQIDATIETRWQRLAATLGKDSDWLETP